PSPLRRGTAHPVGDATTRSTAWSTASAKAMFLRTRQVLPHPRQRIGAYGRTLSSVVECGCEVAAVRVEQAGEQPVRAPAFEPVLRPVAREPKLHIAELVEHRCAVEQRATVDWIPVT